MGIICAAVAGTAIALKLNKKIEETLAAAVIIIMLLIYIPSRYLSLIPGLVLAFGFTGGCLVYCIYRLIRGREDLKSVLFSWGGLAICIYSVFFAFYAFHRDFSHPDELYGWGLAAKNWYHYLTMYSPLATDMAAEQTPFLPLWNVFSAFAWFGFSDTICYFNQNMFIIALMLPVYARMKSRMDAPRFLLITLILPSLLMLSGMESFRYILGDTALAASFIYFVINVLSYLETQDRSYYILSVVGILAVCMIKRIGIICAALMIFSVTHAMMEKSESGIKNLGIYTVVVTLISISWFGIEHWEIYAIPALVYGGSILFYYVVRRLHPLWENHRDALIMVTASCTAVGLLGVFIILARVGAGGYGHAVTARFLEDLFSVVADDGFITLSYGICVLAIIGLGAYLSRTREKTYLAGIAFYTAIAMMMYAILMLYTLIRDVGPINEYRESIIPRYIIPWEILAVFLILYVFVVDNQHIRALQLLMVFIVLVCITDTGELYRGLFNKHRCIGYYALENADIELQSGDMVYFIDEENSFAYSDREFYYWCWPAKTNFVDDIFLGNNGPLEIDADTLKGYLINDRYLNEPYDYLYIQSYGEDFIKRFGRLFADPDDIAPGTVFRVIITDDEVTLVKAHK